MIVDAVVNPNASTAGDKYGHGTHVAGIIAGDGTSSTGTYPAGTGPNVKGTYTGVAPGATLYGYGIGEGISVLYATEAFYHILQNGNSFSPRISAVNNSWGDTGGTPFDPNDIISKLTNRLVDNNVTVLFAAGNDGGTGSADATSSYCKNPKPGVICVANYDDDTVSGGRDGGLDASSSRGLASDSTTATFPDISAPGTFIASTCVPALPVCATGPTLEWAPYYGTLTGTSMATPHVAGAVALLLQASPSLVPAQIEDRIQDNAYKYTFGGAYVSDPQNTGGGTTSFDKGAGLLDVKATLNALGTSHGTAVAASNLEVFAGDGGDYPVLGSADLVSLKVTQTTGSSGAAGFRYDLTVANAGDTPPTGLTYALFQDSRGATYRTNISATPTGVTAGGAASAPLVTAAPQDLSRTGNVISFFLSYSALGNAGIGDPITRVWVGSYVGVVQDVAPGGLPSVGGTEHPQFGKPYARV